jgi:osmoprotectant transport system permease protein
MTIASLMTFWSDYRGEILAQTLEHLVLTGIAMGIACAIAIPLGIGLARTRHKHLANAVLGLAGLIQPVPSLALVALAAAVFRLMELPTIGRPVGLVALVAYALLPLLRNTYTGIGQVDPAMVEVATGMGMTGRQTLFRVQLPLALPFIMAGVRISTVWTIGVATLVSLVGAGGLGDLIFRGLSNFRVPLILAGALPAIGLALAFEFGLGKLENLLTPRGLRDSESA